MPAPTDIQLPSRYRDVTPIARGGMGEILRATDQELGRDVAIKVLAERYAEDSSVRARFRREALAAARLSSNPNIVTIFDVAEHEGRPLIVMEYLPGGSLEQRIDGRKPCPQGQVLDWLDQAALALDAAHEAGIVHRDVKPGNLLLDGRSHLKVADFGIASAAGMDSFTQAGTILGTAGYLSPEQARGEKATAASDRYSLAVVAWELLVGTRPFAAESPTAEAAAHANAPVPSAHRANPSLPRAIDAVFERGLAKDPAARYSTAAELVAELRNAVHEDAGDTWAEPVIPTRVAATTATAPSARRWWIPALVALLLAAGVLAAVLASRGGGTDKPTTQAKQQTVVKTVTGPGQTVRQTVTAATPPPPTTQPTTTESAPTTTASSQPSSSSGAALNDAGYRKMGAGDYAGALPLLEQAVQKLQGTGSTTEAYADYNLAYTRFALGQCTDVLSLLDASQSIQGPRPEINRLRAEASKKCG
jgi:eukaryotic-like serine/threonine-protein kinase